ncbi:hypothetical protein [Elizabethkingia meningoseptica]|uniref:hypothetical protein n=1 Tax=Elizabethkingia meningoseptica TaxID=238 RepID=UPI0023AE81A4|nr:hypothetical protein [Elizabethkingia meningoseptica]MDE5525701.1 hypothetical protein [Elizabethkingia meningoseptica]
MARQDFKIDDSGELMIINGDFVIGDSDMQHVEHVVIACPGEYKQFPPVGFGAILQIKKNSNELAFKRDLKIQLEYDGYPDPDIDLSGGYENLKINI